DDNHRVKKGAVLVQLDKEPYQVQVAIKQAAVDAAETDLTAAQAQVRGLVAQARANRFKLEHAIEEVNNQIANLRGAVATLNSKKATLDLAASIGVACLWPRFPLANEAVPLPPAPPPASPGERDV